METHHVCRLWQAALSPHQRLVRGSPVFCTRSDSLISITTFAAALLGSVLSAGSVAVPSWQSDYSQAMATASAQQKPLAVFIGRGDTGYSGVVGGEIPAEAGKLLSKSFVCVYVDTDTADGKSLSSAFGLSKGLVISSKGGNVQALRHTGSIAPTDLTGYLTRYSDPVKAVVTTEKVGETPVSTTVPAGAVFGGCPNGRCGTTSSAGYYQPTYSPTYAPAYPSFSSCPNGRCPNAR